MNISEVQVERLCVNLILNWTRVLIGDLPLIFLSPVDQPLLHHY